MKTLAAVLLTAIALSGCASAASTRTAAPSVRGSAHSAPTPPTGSLSPDPALREAQHPDPNFDYGYVVQITAAGLHPQTLLSGCCLPVSWKNLTNRTLSIVFDHQPVGSSPIPPGGTWVFKPHNTESVLYHTTGGPEMNGALQVQQTFES